MVMLKTRGSIRRIVTVEEHLRIDELAERTGLGIRTIKDAIAAGRRSHGSAGIAPIRKCGRAVLVPASSANKWLKSLNA